MTDWFDEAEKAMAEDTTDDSETWDPKPGDILKGVFLKGRVNRGGEYGPSLMVLIKEIGTETTYRLFANRKMLKDGLFEALPAKGSLISIKFEGEKEPQKEGGRKYFGYQVMAQQQDTDYWGILARDLYAKPAHQNPVATQIGPDEDPF
jgi:hypothetical protein